MVLPVSDKVAAIGTQADQPAAGSVILKGNEVEYPHFKMTFILDGARVPVTDATTSGSYGALKLFDFREGAVSLLGSRQNYTAFAEGDALTGGAGDAAFKIGVGTVAIAAAADNALTGTSVNLGGATSVTLSGGTGTGTTVTGAGAVIDGTTTAADVVLNVSGSAATIDATSTLDVTGEITIFGVMLGDD